LAHRCLLKIATHGYALLIADHCRAPRVCVGRNEVPAGKEADDHPWTGGGIRLLPLHGVPQCFARVVGSPNAGIAGGTRLPSHDHNSGMGWVLYERMFCAPCTWLGAGSLAEEIVFFDSSEAGVRIGGADPPEPVRVHTQFFFKLQPVSQRRARVLELQPFGLFEFAKIQVAFVPALEISELVVGGEERMGLAVTLDLGRLIEPFPLFTSLGVFSTHQT